MPKKFKKARSASAAATNGAAGVRTLEVTSAKDDHETPSSQPVHAGDAPSRRTVQAIAAGLAVLVALVFFRVAAFQFVSFDDPYSVYNNPHVTQGLTAESIRWAFTDTATYYWQPLTYLSHMLVVQVLGMNSGWHHVVNVVIHAANVLLLFFFLRRLTGAVWRSAAVATLFAIHPLAVESVAWVTERNNLLVGLFWIATMWTYVDYVRRPSSGRYLLVAAGLVLALMSKPVAVMLPVALLVLDWWPLDRFRSVSFVRLLREKWLLFVIVAASALSTLSGTSGQLSTTVLPIQVRIANAVVAYSQYLLKLFWPHPLGAFYQFWLPPTMPAAAGLMAFFLLTLGALSLAKRAPYLLAGWLWYVVVLFPVTGIFQAGGQAIADRFTYLPLIGVYVALVWGAAECIREFNIRREVVIAACAVIGCALAVKSWIQTETWQDSVAMYTQAAKAQDSEPMHRNLAIELVAQGRLDEAIEHYRKAIRLDPGRSENYFALGHALATAGMLPEAAEQLTEGLRRAPNYLPGRKELGFVYMRQNRIEDAAAAFRRVLRANPNDPDAIPMQAMIASVPEKPDARDDAAPTIATENAPAQGPDPGREVQVFTESLKWNFGMVLGCVVLAFLIPKLGRKPFEAAERGWVALSQRPRLSVAIVALLPMLARLALLPLHPVPVPRIADEFGYLLVADTFANGRITNPTPAMWEHFVSSYVFFQPTYTAKYPFAEPVFMAGAQVLGLAPWFGVWLACGLMCAGLYWMLRGWIPPKWALLGALIVAIRFSITSYWMNSYWGGAVAALGGALVLGALPRIRRQPNTRNSVLFGLGLLLIANTRPYEGFLLAIPVAAILGWWFFRTKTVSLSDRLRYIVVPVSAVLVLGGAFMLYYNWKVTGDPLLMPYKLNQKLYGTPTPFYFQSPLPEPRGLERYKDLRDNYLWQRMNYDMRSPLSKFAEVTGLKFLSLWDFFVQPAMTLPLLFLPVVWMKKREYRPLMIAAAIVLAGIAMYPFFFPHYAAPIFAIFVLLLVQGLRYMRQYEWKGRPVGVFAFRAILLLLLCLPIAELLGPMIEQTRTGRSQVIKQLEAAGGKHVVMVRYRPDHILHYGIIYNNADIDSSNIIWARDMDPKSNEELFKYYRDRNIWLFEADEKPAKLSRYPGT